MNNSIIISKIKWQRNFLYELIVVITGFLFVSKVFASDEQIKILSQEDKTIKIELNIENLVFESVLTSRGVEFIVKLDKNGSPIYKKGAPDIEKITTSINILEDHEIKIKVLHKEFVDYNDIEVAPSKGPLKRTINPNTILFAQSEIYLKDEFFPNKLFDTSKPYTIRDLVGLNFLFYPVQYNPKQKTLRFYKKIIIELKQIPYSSSNTTSYSVRKPIAYSYDKIYEKHFLNYESNKRSSNIINPSMLIICKDEFIESLTDFSLWKNQIGVSTSVIPMSSIGTTAIDIKEFVMNYYQSKPFVFLLLVGNLESIPSLYRNGAPSDPSFGYLIGDDYYPEVLVGRLPVNNQVDLSLQLQKTLLYEKNPQNSNEWYKKAIGIASSEGAGDGDNGESDEQHMDNIISEMLGYTYSYVDKIYETTGATSFDVTQAINEGRSLIHYVGHASLEKWTTTHFSNTDIKSLQNFNKWPFVYSVSCLSGAFHLGESFAEVWLNSSLNNQPTGAIGFVGSSIDQLWAPPMSAQDEFTRLLIVSTFDNYQRSAGGLFYNSTLKMIEKYGIEGSKEAQSWHYFGDPSITLRSDISTEITASYPSEIFLGQESLEIIVDQNNALISLSQDGVLLYKDTTVAQESKIIDLSLLDLREGQLDLVISGYNLTPLISKINVTNNNDIYIVVKNFEFLEEDYTDNKVEIGERISLKIYYENLGNLNDEIEVNINSNEENIKIENKNLLIIPSEIAENNFFILSFEALHGFYFNTIFDINFDFLSNLQKKSDDRIQLSIISPKLDVSNFKTVDLDYADSFWKQGENIIFKFTISNKGDAPSRNSFVANLDILNLNTVIFENSKLISELNPGESVDIFYTVSPQDEEVFNKKIDLNLELIDQSCLNNCFYNRTYSKTTFYGKWIYIWDPLVLYSNYFSSSFVNGYLKLHEIAFDYSTEQDLPTNLKGYHSAFVSLGLYPNNFILLEKHSQKLESLLIESGNIYLEGGDTWFYDERTSLHDMFNILGISDGDNTLNEIMSLGDSIWGNDTFLYQKHVDYIDHLIIKDSFSFENESQVILKNLNPEYNVAISNFNNLLNYKTIGSSFTLEGLTEESQEKYFTNILKFFDLLTDKTCLNGDFDKNYRVDILDILYLVDKILNSFFDDSEALNNVCSLDYNNDYSIDIIDIIDIVDYILKK